MYALLNSAQATESDNAMAQANRLQKAISTLTINLDMMVE